MNVFTKRQIKLMKMLYDEKQYISSKTLANDMNLSVRTIKTEIRNLNDILFQYGSKIDDLADELYISRSLLTQLLKDVRTQLGKYRLKITSRSNYGIIVEGNEIDKRLAVSDFFFHNDLSCGYLEYEPFSKKKFTQNDKDFILEVMKSILHKYAIELSEYAMNHLLLHINISLKRCMFYNYVTEYDHIFNEIKNTMEFRAATEMIQRLENKYQLLLPMGEIVYLAEHIQSKRILDHVQMNMSEMNRLQECIEVMYLEINNNFGFDFTLDNELYQYLYLHIPQMVKRLKFHMTIRNTSVIENKRRYLFATKVTHSACAVIEQYYNVKIDLNEFGYLLLYFNLAITKFEINKMIKIAIFTCRGRPESMMYLNEIREHFASRKYEIKNIDKIEDKYDLIISLYQFDTVVSCPVVIIENDDYIEKIQKKLYEIRYQNLDIQKYINEKYTYFDLKGETKKSVLENFYKILYEKKLISEIPNKENEFTDDELGNGIVHFQDSYRIVRENMWFICTLKKPIYWDRQMTKILILTKTKKESDKDLYNLCRIVSKWANSPQKISDFLKQPKIELLLEAIDDIC